MHCSIATERTIDDQRETRWASPPATLRDDLLDLGMLAAAWAGVGLNELFGSRAGGKFGFVTYHRVARHVPGLPRPEHNVTPDRFREQLTGLLARAWTPWPLSRVFRYRNRGEAVPPHTFVVTFDDGYESVYRNAWPVLREFGIPATVFVSTAYLDSEAPLPFDNWAITHRDRAPRETYRCMTTQQCREMVEDGLLELGAHTHTHQDFRNRPDEFLQDMLTSLSILQSRFGIERPVFAFPYGSPRLGFSSGELAAAARQAGVSCGLTTEAVLVDPQSDPFGWGRFNAFRWDTSATLAAKLDGWYSWAPQLWRWLWRKRVVSG